MGLDERGPVAYSLESLLAHRTLCVLLAWCPGVKLTRSGPNAPMSFIIDGLGQDILATFLEYKQICIFPFCY